MALTRPVGEQLRFVSSKTGTHILDTYLEAAEIGGNTLSSMLTQLFNPTTGILEPFEMRLVNNILEFRTAGTISFIPVVSYQAFYDGLQSMLTAATTAKNQSEAARNTAETYKNAAATSATAASNSASAAAQSASLAASFTPANIQEDLNQSFDLALMFDFDSPIDREEKYLPPEIILRSPAFLQTTDKLNNKLGRVVLTYSEKVTRGSGNATISSWDGNAWVLIEQIPEDRIIVDGIYITLRLQPIANGTQFQISLDSDFVRDVDGNRSVADSSYTFTTA